MRRGHEAYPRSGDGGLAGHVGTVWTVWTVWCIPSKGPRHEPVFIPSLVPITEYLMLGFCGLVMSQDCACGREPPTNKLEMIEI